MAESTLSLSADWRNAVDEADPENLEPHYSTWVAGLTKYGLHDKADIATLLALLTVDIFTLRTTLAAETERRERAEEEHQTLVKDFCRLRGKSECDADLKHFVEHVDHAENLSRGEFSCLIDLAQGQTTRAETAERALAEAQARLLDISASIMQFSGHEAGDEGNQYDPQGALWELRLEYEAMEAELAKLRAPVDEFADVLGRCHAGEMSDVIRQLSRQLRELKESKS